MNLGPEYPEVLADLAAVLRELLVESGLAEPKAQEIAREAAERIRQHFGGQLIYIPLGLRHEVMKRWNEIWSKWSGPECTPQLAKEYRCSEVHINRIVRHMREVESRARHTELFAEPAKPQS
jgi:Mor family transcriptional regulator